MAKAKFMIVVDADVARSSGETVHPVSASCRKILDLMMANDHRFVACQKLREEWKTHSSNYAKKWLAAMVARKQVCFIEYGSDVAHAINLLHVDENTKSVAIKDAHLVDAAKSNGKFIASRDENARMAFMAMEGIRPLIRGIIWANPVTNHELLHNKLLHRANPDALVRLG